MSTSASALPVHYKHRANLALAALGVVYGDIGTSPLYALKTTITLAGGHPSATEALGLLSLIIWALVLTVTLKYISFVMRADNQGEGGILALMSLLLQNNRRRAGVLAVGLLGAALIYGDGAITPAISVLSAVEGLKIALPALEPYILPLTAGTLVILFAMQSLGTAKIGWVFGPIMVLWFIVIGGLGIYGVSLHPGVVAALNPWYGFHYLAEHGRIGFLALGGVFLTITGAEALYADMGHIGARPIRLIWYGLVLPALVLNYAGQTALLLSGAPVDDNVFYRLCPPELLLPLIVLATAATVIASQAIITGAFSMTRQAMRLGWFPRLRVKQTSATAYGQIYVRAVNWLLMAATFGLVFSFRTSDNLAAAYGIAVSLTMLLTTMLLFLAMREIWHWPPAACWAVAGLFTLVDSVFLAANLLKVLDGGWVPLAFALLICIVMQTWHRGTAAVLERLNRLAMPAAEFAAWLAAGAFTRVPGTAIFLTPPTGTQAPPLLLWHVANNRALHRQVLTLSIVFEAVPHTVVDQRLTLTPLAAGCWQGVAHYGFMETPDIPDLLRLAGQLQPELDFSDTVYFHGHWTILHRKDGHGLPLWQERLYAFLQRNSAHRSALFHLPRDAVMEIGRQVEI